jgi:hypothetical protein
MGIACRPTEGKQTWRCTRCPLQLHAIRTQRSRQRSRQRWKRAVGIRVSYQAGGKTTGMSGVCKELTSFISDQPALSSQTART